MTEEEFLLTAGSGRSLMTRFCAAARTRRRQGDSMYTRVYIAGPITGIPEEEYRRRFAERKVLLEQMGYAALNPCDIGAELRRAKLTAENREPTHEEYMNACLPELLRCDGISLLDGWEQSSGARTERDVAAATGKTFVEVRRCRWQ